MSDIKMRAIAYIFVDILVLVLFLLFKNPPWVIFIVAIINEADTVRRLLKCPTAASV